ncbi:neurofilament medium polypeptide-like [Raphanus sativus]|uniref:Uncharacterized protein LOC108807592 n=1 Tax=Raphanus sativus TaxID=3726 RepID=A0A6J0JIA3_RAPSA|nr:uncharacterized protein LOC108807592 [Raphanus sativus]KAJ4886460.1 neurofilament medium polypeptide-like [Raphanus sativus]
MKKRVVFQFTVFDESTKELAKETAREFEGVTKVVEVEGEEGQLEVRGEFSTSELKKELKKIDESVETIKIRAYGVKEPEVKIQQQDKGKKPKVKNQQQGKGKEPEVKIQQQDKGKEPEVKTQQQDEGKILPSDVASSSNSRGYLEKAIDVAKVAKDMGVNAAGKAIGLGADAAGKAIVLGADAAGKAIEYYGKKNKENEAKAKLERKPIVGKGGNWLPFQKAHGGGVFEAIIRIEEEKAQRWRKQTKEMEVEQRKIREKEEMEQRKNKVEKEKQKVKEKNLAINKEEEKLKVWEENMKKQGLENNSCACIIL